jgi:protein-S-isoprenylcysteine O-methyltransferase Ste14
MLALLAAVKANAFRIPRHWPALVVGAVAAIYWIRVFQMVLQSRKKSGHGANLIPPRPLDKAIRVIWTPATFAAFFVRVPQRYPAALRPVLTLWHLPAPIGWAAAVAAVVGLLATFVCWKRMGTSWRMGIDPDERTQLVCSGPYAYVRHPIYGLSTVLMVCTVLAVPNVVMFVAGALHALALQWEARREESHLTNVHGDEYRQYARCTGRFFPISLRGYRGRESSGPRRVSKPTSR